jgi:AcrR family transcriptional regulator
MLLRVGNAPQTRAKLLAAARRAFADLGYAKARVEDIVSRAGVGHGTFYAYFPNKRAALTALLRENAATLLEAAAEPWGSGDIRASLVSVLDGLADLYERDADLMGLSNEAATHDPELGAVFDDVRNQFVARVARNIERAQAAGLARPVDATTAATAVVAMAERTLFLRVARAEPPDRALTVHTLADLWYHALYLPEAERAAGAPQAQATRQI